MPKIMIISGYQISIWSNGNNEPIHVHISKRKPTANSTKLWLSKSGTFVVAHNKSRISEKDLKNILVTLNANINIIVDFWKGFHGYEKYFD